MGHADHRSLGHGGMLCQHSLHLGWIHVEPRHDDQILGPVHDEQVAVVVGHGDVAGVQPAVFVDRRGAGLRVVEVAREHVGAAHPDLAGVAWPGVVARGVHQPHLQALQRPADGADRGVVVGGHGHARRRLGEPVALVDAYPEALRDVVYHPIRQSRRAGHREAQRAEGLGRHELDLRQRPPHGRRACQHADLLLDDRLDGGDRIEALHQHQGRPGPHGEAQDGVEAQHVEQRDDAQRHVVGA